MKGFSCWLCVLLFVPCFSFAGDEGTRSSIHEVDGFAYLSEDKTLGEIRSEAFALARRQALEAARTHIQSLTRVENMVMEYDLVESGAEGVVRVLEQKDHGIEGNSRYHVWIRAEVEYVLKPKSKQPVVQPVVQSVVGNTDVPLTVSVWTEKADYKEGEQIRIHVRGNRDWYGVVADRSSDGSIVQLLPNAHRTDNFFKAHTMYTIPGEGDVFSLDVFPPFGQDEIIVYGSDKPLGRVDLESIGAGLGRFRGSIGDFGTALRGIRPVATGEKAGPAQFYQNTCTIITGP